MSLGKRKVDVPYTAEKWKSRFEAGVENHEEKHRLIYDELVNILSPRYVSDDPAVYEVYAREKQTLTIRSKGRAEFVVLPGSTEDVQEIMRLANRYNFPFSVMSTGAWSTCFAAEGIPYWCQIDLKRMDKLEIDEKNMYAIVQPYVTHAQLQVEAMKRGLFNGTPSAGSQSSVLANHIAFGFQSTPYRNGFGGKNILGVEWVLPNGDILRTGSLATPGAGYFCGEGPGPDARALLRGLSGHHASLGIITRVAVKLFPWPGPPIWSVDGVAPDIIVNLPPEKFKWYFITYPTFDETIEVMREICKVEIGAILLRWDLRTMTRFASHSREEMLRRAMEGYFEKFLGKGAQVITVGIWGWASEKQVAYEETILEEIMEETGGKLVPDEVYQKFITDIGIDSIRAISNVRIAKLGSGIDLTSAELDGFSDVHRGIKTIMELQEKYTPPLLGLPSCWVAPYDLGHHNLVEVHSPGLGGEEAELEIVTANQELEELSTQEGSVNFPTTKALQNVVGPKFANIHLITAKIKNAFDPNNIANPSRLIDMEEMGDIKR